MVEMELELELGLELGSHEMMKIRCMLHLSHPSAREHGHRQDGMTQLQQQLHSLRCHSVPVIVFVAAVDHAAAADVGHVPMEDDHITIDEGRMHVSNQLACGIDPMLLAKV